MWNSLSLSVWLAPISLSPFPSAIDAFLTTYPAHFSVSVSLLWATCIIGIASARAGGSDTTEGTEDDSRATLDSGFDIFQFTLFGISKALSRDDRIRVRRRLAARA